MKKQTEGYVVICIGAKYERMLHNFINTLRKNGDQRDVHVITDVSNEPLFEHCLTDFERYGTLPKISLDKFIPFDHNIFLDIDMLCIGNTEPVWDLMKAQDVSQIQLGVPGLHERDNALLQAAAAERGWSKPPTVQGGFIYLRKEGLNTDFFEWMRNEGFPNYSTYATDARPYKNSRTDQELFALAHGKFGTKFLSMFEHPVMTFLDAVPWHVDNAPTKRVIYREMYKDQNEYVSFCHAMSKPGHPIYENMYAQVMSW